MQSLRSATQSAIDSVSNNKYYIKDALIIGGVIGGLLYAHDRIVSSSKKSRASTAARLKKEELLNKTHACFDTYNKQINQEIESLILSSSATEIRELIINGKLKCSQVTLVICYNNYKCNKILNAILEEHYDSAYQTAIELDLEIENKRNSSDKQEWINYINNKPLLGIPISVKDLFAMKDSDSTCGLQRLCNQKHDDDGTVIKLVRECGGIPYCKTNCPQLNMLPESCNNIIGYTKNPYNGNNVAGGSSGGEACLVACNASKLGIGTDIGGSLRIPASFCGCIAYKPSSRRTPQTGKSLPDRTTYTNKFGIVAASGPLAMNMDDIVRFCKVLWSSNGHLTDPYMAAIPFREQIFSSKKKLRIGYWSKGDGWFTSTKCVQRGIMEAVDVLSKEYDYEIIELPFKDGFDVVSLYMKYMGAEANMKEFMRALDGTEELFGGFKTLKKLQEIPQWIRKFIIAPVMPMIGEYRKHALLTNFKGGDLTLKEFKDTCKQMTKWKYEFWDWCDSFNGEIDAIICPTTFYPAPKHDFSANFLITLTSTFLQNLLDCAAGNYGPVTYVNKNECHYNLNDLPENERDSYSKELDLYMKDAYGLPIGVQVMAKPYNDEIVLRVMNDLDKYYKKPENKPKSLVNLITDE